MKRIILFLMICFFHFQIFANDTCQNVTLRHADILPNWVLLNFVHEEEGKENTDYKIQDSDGALSLLTFLNLYLQEERPPENSFKDLLGNLAERLIEHYNVQKLKKEEEGIPLAANIFDARIDLVNQLFVDDLSYNTLSDFYNEFLNHVKYHFSHVYQTDYYVHNQNRDEHFSSQYITVEQKLELKETVDGVPNPIGYYMVSNCQLRGSSLGDIL